MKKLVGKAFRCAAGAALAALVACAVLLGSVAPTPAYAGEVEDEVVYDGFIIHLWMDEDTGEMNSLWLVGYQGTKTELTLPSSIVYKGKTYPIYDLGPAGGHSAFQNNTTITKVIIPDGYETISNDAFKGCTKLKEVVIGSTVGFIASGAFADCPNLKDYRIGSSSSISIADNAIATTSDGEVYEGVTVHVVKGSAADENFQDINAASKAKGGATVKIVYESNPAAEAKVAYVVPSAGSQLAAGASIAAVDALLTSYAGESDPAGSLYAGVQLKLGKAKKTSIKLKWAKVSGAKSYIVYANACGKKNTYKKLAVVSKTAYTAKKVAGAKVKKGTYYKFIVVAANRAKGTGNVVSTSKTVHVATPGGKVGNDKKVKTAAKKNKIALKAKKTFKLKAKAVAASKKLKVKKHRGIKYESTNTAVATVSAKGIVKGVKKGSCYVYAYAQDGVAAKVKVTVK